MEMIHKGLVGIGYAALRAGVRLPEIGSIARFSEQGHIVDLLHNLKINYVLDVGANKGIFAKHLRMAGYQGHIFCFEPIRSDCDAISRLAGADPLWQVFNFALGSESGAKPFNVFSTPGGNTVFSSFLELNGKKDLPSRVESITMRRMDEVLDELIQNPATARVFLKIDTQGYDIEVLKGCIRWLDKVSLLQSEVTVTPIYRDIPRYTEALAHYESLGFSLLNLYVVNRNQDRSISAYDCVMARLDRFICQ
jgi:FkbM family methyltransferase